MLRTTIRVCVALVLGAISAAQAAAQSAQPAPQPGETYRERINKGTVGIISGGINGTYIRIAADLANVLDSDDLRILAIMGKGSLQNIDDILYLRGIDIGIVQSDVFAFVKRQGRHPNIDRRIRYITKLYNEELHLLAGRSIARIEDLAGRKVNIGVRGSGTFITATLVFETLGIAIIPTSFDQALAVEKVKSGEIAATVYVSGKPTALFKDIAAGTPLHFLEVPLTPKILDTYLPSRLTAEDYPNLIPAGTAVRTLAVGAVMAVYNWPQDHPRHAKVARFIEAFFSRFGEFQKPPRHPKWREVSLSATVPGWTRFAPAEAWLRNNAMFGDGAMRQAFEEFLATQAPDVASRLQSEEDRRMLFDLFLMWQARQAQALQ
ncbi:MAG: TAXI family TRAP transporter solute-binding subunit [Alphaproteobacteria bacterium]|nr:MAG: TAXI family TRAP transporter solute-binding subunit [Alphaproteobacteria bacterium]